MQKIYFALSKYKIQQLIITIKEYSTKQNFKMGKKLSKIALQSALYENELNIAGINIPKIDIIKISR